MRLTLANHSSYPRVAAGTEGQRLRRAYGKRETGELTDTEFHDIVRGYVTEVIREQEDAGLDVVTDGLVSWYDLISHPSSHLDGVEIDGLVRFFDTNTYVRQPEVVEPIQGSFGLAGDYAAAASIAGVDVKAVIPGPYTLARHSIAKTNGDLSSLAMSYAEALGAELEALGESGARFVQIEEPSLLKFPDDAELVRRVLERAMQTKGDLTVSLATYFGDATTIYGELLRMPVDVLAFDLIYGPGLVETIAQNSPDRPVALGAIDGRNTKPDDTDAVARTVGRVMDALDARGVDEVIVQPSCGLEFLPRDRAKRKLERMRDVKTAISKAGA